MDCSDAAACDAPIVEGRRMLAFHVREPMYLVWPDMLENLSIPGRMNNE
jgi:hypothetical protein